MDVNEEAMAAHKRAFLDFLDQDVSPLAVPSAAAAGFSADVVAFLRRWGRGCTCRPCARWSRTSATASSSAWTTSEITTSTSPAGARRRLPFLALSFVPESGSPVGFAPR